MCSINGFSSICSSSVFDNSPAKLDSLPGFERGFRPACEVRIEIFDPRTILSAGDSPFFVEIFSFWTTIQVPDVFSSSFLSVVAIFFLPSLYLAFCFQYTVCRKTSPVCLFPGSRIPLLLRNNIFLHSYCG